jgi:hypothetical protein
MYFFEIVRLCALWDGPDRDKENVPTINVPTIIELIDDADVLPMLTGETQAHWPNATPPRLYHTSSVRATQKAEQEAVQWHREKWADEQAAETAGRLDNAIAQAKSVIASPRLRSVLNIRHKHLAPSLTETREERKGFVHPMKYGDERWLFEETLNIVRDLHVGINGAAFNWEGARRIARRNAEALWKFCTFTVSD